MNEQQQLAAVARLGRRGPLVAAGGLTGVLVAIKWQALGLPASWDASWALYPAATYLADSGFDLVGLLAEPTGADLGPNTNHSLSIVVLTTALAMRLLGSAASEVMHVLMLALAALAVVGAYRFFRSTLSPTVAVVLAGVTALLPVASAQMGLVYVDVPVWAATVWAAVFVLDRDRLGWASTMAVLAAASKASGVITAAALGLFILLTERDLRRAAAAALPGAAVASLHLLAGSANRAVPAADGVLTQWDRGLASVLAMPAVAGLLVLAAGSMLLIRRRAERTDVLAWVMIGAFVVAYLAGPLIGVDVPLLSRHWIQIVPFLLFASWRFAGRYGFAAKVGLIVVLVGWSIGSADGRWHPAADLNNEIFQERTAAVYDVIELRRRTIAAAAGNDLTTMSSLNTWFRARYPAAGFVTAPQPWIPASHLDDLDPADPATFPEEFVVIIDSPGRLMDDDARLAQQLDDSGAFSVTIQTFEVGRFSSELRTYRRP